MKIKQQEQIKAFLMEEFGASQGGTLFAQQEKILHTVIENTKNKSKNQIKTLVQTILPRVALYKALLASGLSNESVFTCMRKYMMDIVAAEKHSSTAKMELVPGFYFLYSRAFLQIMRTTDLWESVQHCSRGRFEVDITKCLWHTACTENGCPELCPLFCDVDNVTYGGLRKMGFLRTKTLGCGGDCCDFRFYKK